MRGNIVAVRTDPAQHFTGALAQNAIATLDLVLPLAIGAGGHSRAIVRQLIVSSIQALSWEVAFFSRYTFQTAPIGQSCFLGSFQFTQTSGKQYGSGPFYWQAQNVDLPYADADFEDLTLPKEARGGKLHLMLINRSTTGKLAGDAGAIQLTSYLEPTYG